MSETLKIILMVLFTIGAFYISLRIAGWKLKKACDFIRRDLEEKRAFDPASAVALPYSKASIFHMGLRDYRPKALDALVKHDQIRVTEEGRYYLREGHKLNSFS